MYIVEKLYVEHFFQMLERWQGIHDTQIYALYISRAF